MTCYRDVALPPGKRKAPLFRGACSLITDNFPHAIASRPIVSNDSSFFRRFASILT